MLTKKNSKKMHANLNKYQVQNWPALPGRNVTSTCNRRVKSFPTGRVAISSQQTGTCNCLIFEYQLKCWEAVFQRCSVKKMFLEISKNSLENTCARVSMLIKLQACEISKNTFVTEHLRWLPLNAELVQETQLRRVTRTVRIRALW